VGLPARYLRGGNVRRRGLQKSRWRVRFGCIVATHPDGQDCDILRYCALFSILNGALRLAMAHRPSRIVRAMSRRFEPVLVWYGSAGPPSRPGACHGCCPYCIVPLPLGHGRARCAGG